ncbi:MAG: hypothetical protein KC609_08775 [Myxococcales bacterium]|nr:hypothetical protein [Myxococcales bacterium]
MGRQTSLALIGCLAFTAALWSRPVEASGNATLHISTPRFSLTLREHIRKIFRRGDGEQRYHREARARMRKVGQRVIPRVESVLVGQRQVPPTPLDHKAATCHKERSQRRYPCAFHLTVDRGRFSIALRAYLVRPVDELAFAALKSALKAALREK